MSAPLSTLAHWQREFKEWTDMNCVLYHDEGGAKARELIREHEWRYKSGNNTQKRELTRFNVLLVSYNILLQDWEEFRAIRWRAVVVDEAHRLKNRDSQLWQGMKLMKKAT